MLETDRLLIVKPSFQYTQELFEIHSNISSTLYTPPVSIIQLMILS